MTKSKLLSFHGDQAVKDKYISRLQEHYKADEIIKGQYWEDGKGCAVGCTVHEYASAYASADKFQKACAERILLLRDKLLEMLANSK